MRNILLPLIFGFLLAGLYSCSKPACTVTSNTDCICTMQYDPVCGCDGKTYGNSCEAECAEIEFTPGECN